MGLKHNKNNRKISRSQRSHAKPIVLGVTGVVILVGLVLGGYLLWQKHIRPEPVRRTVASNQQPVQSIPKESPPAEKPQAPPAAPSRDAIIPPIENGLAPVISSIPTKQAVVFLTIDDGAYKHASVIELMKRHEVKASLFLTYNIIRGNPDFFKELIAMGSLVENHTISHTRLTGLSYAGQKQEICDQADKMERLYGRRPVLFRPPGGHYNETTRKAAADCGMKAVAMWTAKANGGSMQYQVGKSLRPGDIVLMHFRPEFSEDMQSFISAMQASGLRTDLLENWLTE